MKSISDDDLCSNCTHCSYVQAADRHQCSQGFPGVLDDDDYVIGCNDFAAKAVETGLNKAEYRKARRLLRDNGSAALRCMTEPVRQAMERVLDMQLRQDDLKERAEIVRWCNQEGITCTPVQTGSLERLQRWQQRSKA